MNRQCIGGTLIDETKTLASEREVALVPSLAAALLDARAHARFSGDDDPVFATRTGTFQDSHNVRPRLRSAFAAAEAPWATPHTFRHTLATELLARGYDSSVVAAILGHRTDATPRRVYIHAARVPRFDDLDVPLAESGSA